MFDFFAQDFFSRFQISAPASTYEKQGNLQNFCFDLFCDCDFCQSANLQVQTLHLSCQIFQTEIDQEIEIWCFSFFFKSHSVLIQNQEKWIGWNQPKDWTQQILILNL